MFGLTPLGLVHTAISLVALWTGLHSLLRGGAIDPRGGLGRIYLWATVLTCLTSFGIFRHGGFNAGHGLGVLTLLVVGVALLPLRAAWWRYAQTLLWTLTLFLHMVPGLNETFTRLPVGAPLFTGPDDPRLQASIGVVFVVFAVVMLLQLLQMWRSRPMVARSA
ncbi:hypothetical protein [Pseudorhodoferax soli]|jgi:hypothetical protein|uniref:Uncharacterized protein n=1 Tax=Pseudorhodoferax soli TaxID=545864 RepID=A0A368XL82_9BURK|nr:hypothetical protein [Pseudorhodoferax soli]RCW68742.1 hypothetical protein DES41_107264 [Pseudorhodoferax soli]